MAGSKPRNTVASNTEAPPTPMPLPTLPSTQGQAVLRQLRPYLIGASLFPIVAALSLAKAVIIPTALAGLLTFLILFMGAYGVAWPIAVAITEWGIRRLGYVVETEQSGGDARQDRRAHTHRHADETAPAHSPRASVAPRPRAP